MEGMQEFGKRNRVEIKKPEEKADFARERPMYERLRGHNPEINTLLTRYDAITEYQEAGHGVQEDVKEKEKIESELRKIFKEKN